MFRSLAASAHDYFMEDFKHEAPASDSQQSRSDLFSELCEIFTSLQQVQTCDGHTRQRCEWDGGTPPAGETLMFLILFSTQTEP